MEISKIDVNGNIVTVSSENVKKLETIFSVIDDDNYVNILLDSNERILEATRKDGTKVINGNIESPTIDQLRKEFSNNENFAKMYIEKDRNGITIYKKIRNSKEYIAYPLKYRHSEWKEYPAYGVFLDNYGIMKPYVAEYDSISKSMVNKLMLFSGGEAECAINVPNAYDNAYTYVGGSAHGYENIVNSENGREFYCLVDGNVVDESTNITLQECSFFEAFQHSLLYQAYSNTNPWADVNKHWSISENDKLEITTSVKILRDITIHQAQFGMFCVYRHKNGDYKNNDYITYRAIRDNKPFLISNTSDRWNFVEHSIWNASDNYKMNDCVKFTEVLYRCITPNHSETFNYDEWDEIQPLEKNKQYQENEFIIYNNNIYKSRYAFKSRNTDDFLTETIWSAEITNRDYNTHKISQYGNMGYGFSMEIKNDTRKPNGGMNIGTNNGLYNKIYFDLTGDYTPQVGEELKATQVWSIYKIENVNEYE